MKSASDRYKWKQTDEYCKWKEISLYNSSDEDEYHRYVDNPDGYGNAIEEINETNESLKEMQIADEKYHKLLRSYGELEGEERLKAEYTMNRCWLTVYRSEVTPVYFNVVPSTQKMVDEISDKLSLPPLVREIIKEHFPKKRLRFVEFQYSDRLTRLQHVSYADRSTDPLETTVMKYMSPFSERCKDPDFPYPIQNETFNNLLYENSYERFQRRVEESIFLKLVYLQRGKINDYFDISRDDYENDCIEYLTRDIHMIPSKGLIGPLQRFDKWARFHVKRY